jgi:nucleotide-binding universal stress UspA family protein
MAARLGAMKLQRILVGVDSSTAGPSVLAAAAGLAARVGARLVVFRAVGIPPDFPREQLEHMDGRVTDFIRDSARRDLERMTAGLPPGLVESVVVTDTSPWDGICGAAMERDVDLVVVGAHGHGRIGRLLGGTAHKVVNHCDRNVLIVKAPVAN